MDVSGNPDVVVLWDGVEGRFKVYPYLSTASTGGGVLVASASSAPQGDLTNPYTPCRIF